MPFQGVHDAISGVHDTISGVRDAVLPSGAKTIVKTMEFPKGKFASGASTIVKTKHSRWHRERRNGIWKVRLVKGTCKTVFSNLQSYALIRSSKLKLVGSTFITVCGVDIQNNLSKSKTNICYTRKLHPPAFSKT